MCAGGGAWFIGAVGAVAVVVVDARGGDLGLGVEDAWVVLVARLILIQGG